MNKIRIHNPQKGDFHPSVPDRCGGNYLTETAGYVPKEVRLQMLIQSGERLEQYRKRVFPAYETVETPIDSIDFDPTSQKGYDFFDWHEDTQFVKSQLRYSERQALKAKKIQERTNSEVQPPKELDETVPEPKEPA